MDEDRSSKTQVLGKLKTPEDKHDWSSWSRKQNKSTKGRYAISVYKHTKNEYLWNNYIKKKVEAESSTSRMVKY